MPRLFTALALPQQHRTTLSLVQAGLPNARWIEPSDMHITLRFIGDVTPGHANEIADELARANWAAPNIRFNELARFGADKPRSLHVSIHPDETLTRLQKGQEYLMQRLGLPAEGRKYSPHITVARGRGWSAYDVETWLATTGLPSLPTFRPTEFGLYSARESTGGGPYILEQSYPLQNERADMRP